MSTEDGNTSSANIYRDSYRNSGLDNTLKNIKNSIPSLDESDSKAVREYHDIIELLKCLPDKSFSRTQMVVSLAVLLSDKFPPQKIACITVSLAVFLQECPFPASRRKLSSADCEDGGTLEAPSECCTADDETEEIFCRYCSFKTVSQDRRCEECSYVYCNKSFCKGASEAHHKSVCNPITINEPGRIEAIAREYDPFYGYKDRSFYSFHGFYDPAYEQQGSPIYAKFVEDHHPLLSPHPIHRNDIGNPRGLNTHDTSCHVDKRYPDEFRPYLQNEDYPFLPNDIEDQHDSNTPDTLYYVEEEENLTEDLDDEHHWSPWGNITPPFALNTLDTSSKERKGGQNETSKAQTLLCQTYIERLCGITAFDVSRYVEEKSWAARWGESDELKTTLRELEFECLIERNDYQSLVKMKDMTYNALLANPDMDIRTRLRFIHCAATFCRKLRHHEDSIPYYRILYTHIVRPHRRPDGKAIEIMFFLANAYFELGNAEASQKYADEGIAAGMKIFDEISPIRFDCFLEAYAAMDSRDWTKRSSNSVYNGY